jgi:hypothetical protein
VIAAGAEHEHDQDRGSELRGDTDDQTLVDTDLMGSSRKKPNAPRQRYSNAQLGRGRRGRDDFTIPVLRHIAQEVGHRCSNPACDAPTSGPSKQKGGSSVGVGAHITAAAAGGPRFEASLTPEERKSATNAIWLCNTCGRLIDNDAITYTVPQLVEWKRDAIERAWKALASGGRSTSEGLLAAQLELQKQALDHQRKAHETQLSEQQLSRFRDVYGPFLQEAKAYGRAIDEYWKWMYLTQYQADRITREAMRKPTRDAREAMERALQPILLVDSDETRGRLRWELLRPRGFEPIIDTIDNQRAFAEVIHCHMLRLLDGITRLQDNVQEALGHPPREESAASKEFTSRMFAEAKAKVDAIQADIKRQYDASRREPYGAESSYDHRIAETPPPAPPDALGDPTAELRIRVWNVLDAEINEPDAGDIPLLFVREIWREVLVRPVDLLRNSASAWRELRQVVMSCTRDVFYKIIEHAGKPPDIQEKLGAVLKSSGSSYHFVTEKLAPITSDE